MKNRGMFVYVVIAFIGMLFLAACDTEASTTPTLSQTISDIGASPYTPDTPLPTKPAAQGIDIATQIAESDAQFADWVKVNTANPASDSVRFGVLFDPSTHVSQMARNLPTLWIEKGENLPITYVLQPFMARAASAEYRLSIFIDGIQQPVTTSDGVSGLVLKRTLDRGVHHVETVHLAGLPTGQHALDVLLFRPALSTQITATGTTPGVTPRTISPPQPFGGIMTASFRLIVGTQTPPTLPFTAWAHTQPALADLKNAFALVDPDQTANARSSLSLWQPKPVGRGTSFPFAVVLNNPDAMSREYCISALVDDTQTIVNDGHILSCGVLPAHQMLRLLYTLPDTLSIGSHTLQIVRFENPLQKSQYWQMNSDGQAHPVSGSYRVSLTVDVPQ